MTVGEIVVSILTGLGGAGIAAAVFAKSVGRLVGDAILQQVKHHDDKAIEALRADLGQQHQLLSAALASKNADSSIVQDRRVKAVEVVWASVLACRSVAGPALFLYSILVESEFAGAFEDHRLSAGVPGQAEFDRDMVKVMRDQNPEDQKPFISKELWALFFVYRVIVFRVAMRVSYAKSRGEPLPKWHENESGQPEWVVTIAKSVLPQSVVDSAVQTRFHGLNTLVDAVEQRVVAQIQADLSGNAAAKSTIEEGLRLQEALRLAKQAVEQGGKA